MAYQPDREVNHAVIFEDAARAKVVSHTPNRYRPEPLYGTTIVEVTAAISGVGKQTFAGIMLSAIVRQPLASDA